MGLPVLSAGPVTVRHIKKGAGAGAVTVLGATLVPQPRRGLKGGRRGFQSGRFEAVLNDEGAGTVVLPNSTGDDGILHRRRFLKLTDPAYHPGDEWLEIEHANGAVFVATPVDYELTRSTLTLELDDGLGLLNQQRETAAGFWAHAPRDVFEHYTKAWRPIVADDFDAGADPAKWTLTGGATSETGAVLLTPPSDPSEAALTAVSGGWPALTPSSERAWRYEITYDRSLTGVDNTFTFALENTATSASISLSIQTDAVYARLFEGGASPNDYSAVVGTYEAVKNNTSLAIECRDRWLLFYVDGALVATMEGDAVVAAAAYIPRMELTRVDPLPSFVRVKSVLLRRCDPYLMRGADKGDYRLPGLLPAGGLIGTYFDEADLRVTYPDSTPSFYRRVLAPTRQPYARRQDPTINFAAVDPPGWQPPTPPDGEYFSVRWTGAIYLDLAVADVTLRLSEIDNAARLWVGKTMYGQQLLDQWIHAAGGPFDLITGSLRSHLGSVSGWYPIRIDFVQGAAAGGIIFRRSVGGGAYEVVPAAALSPLGIYEAQVRYDSHAEQLKAVALAYGLQYRCDPRTLESGEFPGSVIPRVRVGRDTDKKLTPDESTEASVKGSAGEVIDTLYADAAGLADPNNAATLTAESVNFAALVPGEHMMILSAYESLADITDPILLQTRLASMLGLRLTTWQEIGSRPRGHKELRDTFPLTGALAMFAWQPGDAIRVVDEALDLNDETPRQIIASTWPFVPDGLGSPSVRFRQRPRAQQDALRALVRAALLPQRNYQGQLVVLNGNPSAQPVHAAVTDPYSRVTLPTDLASITRAELVVQYKTDASVGTIEINGVATAIQLQSVGRYDVTPYIARHIGGPLMLARVTGTTGDIQYALELVIRI